MNARVVHFEVPYDDGDRARAFYRDAFGWDLYAMAEMPYTIAVSGPTGSDGAPSEPGYINGGMFDRREGPPHAPTIVLDVADLDAATARVEELGGAVVVARQPVGEMGSVAYVRDTEGNVLGLWETAQR